ncbi:unnamed protein product [Chrysoparadoxa australica]
MCRHILNAVRFGPDFWLFYTLNDHRHPTTHQQVSIQSSCCSRFFDCAEVRHKSDLTFTSCALTSLLKKKHSLARSLTPLSATRRWCQITSSGLTHTSPWRVRHAKRYLPRSCISSIPVTVTAHTAATSTCCLR